MVPFRPVFVEVQEEVKLESGEDREILKRACKTDEHSHPRLWRMLERNVARRYRRMTGKTVQVGAFDWSSIRDWLKEHWPQLVSMMCAVIMLFLAILATSPEDRDDVFEDSVNEMCLVSESLFHGVESYKLMAQPMGGPFGVQEMTAEIRKATVQMEALVGQAQALTAGLQTIVRDVHDKGVVLSTTVQSPWGPFTVVNNLQIGKGLPAFVKQA